jgi:hypothetical protein
MKAVRAYCGRLAVWSFFIGCTLYAPIELTRLILFYGLTPATICELGFMWSLYLIVIGLLGKILGVFNGKRST